jgi:predicted component of type VI protein secretion system
MSLFKQKNYASLVAPLKKMVDDLTTYMDEQSTQIANLEQQKREIEATIQTSETEIAKSKFTSAKINDLLGLDMDGNGILDMDEHPPEVDTENTQDPSQ